MPETEGVIKFSLDHADGPPPQVPGLAGLDGWRTVLHRLGLIGQTTERYDGYGFGNVSLRSGDGFVITGTQTGGAEHLGPEGYVLVPECRPLENAVRSSGPLKPSSESLTHGAIYAAAPPVGCVLHAHDPEIWRAWQSLSLPATPASVAYGTPAMARAVSDLFAQGLGATGVFVTLGHEDGVFALGPDPDAAGAALVAVLAAAVACGH